MLLNDEHFRNFVRISKSFSFSNATPHILKVENTVIRPYIGDTLYSMLDTAYDGGDGYDTMSAEELDLLAHAQPVIANLAMWLLTPLLNVQINDSGIQASHTDTLKPAFDWQVKKYEKAIMNTGFDALEALILFLEEMQAIYPDWESSLASNKSRDLFINGATEFDKYISINSSRRLFTLFKPSLSRIERDLIKGILGAALYNEIKSEILTDSLSANNQLLLEDLQLIQGHSGYAQALMDLSVIVDEQGIHLLENDFSNNVDRLGPAESAKVNSLINLHQGYSRTAQDRLVAFLQENAGTYPLFEESEYYIDPESEDEDFVDDPESGILDF